MSKTVRCSTDIKNKAILDESLKELGIEATTINDDVYTWGQGFDKMSVNLNTGEISYDDMRTSDLNELKMTYSKNLVRSSILKKGHRIKSQKVLSDGKIEIVASY